MQTGNSQPMNDNLRTLKRAFVVLVSNTILITSSALLPTSMTDLHAYVYAVNLYNLLCTAILHLEVTLKIFCYLYFSFIDEKDDYVRQWTGS